MVVTLMRLAEQLGERHYLQGHVTMYPAPS